MFFGFGRIKAHRFSADEKFGPRRHTPSPSHRYAAGPSLSRKGRGVFRTLNVHHLADFSKSAKWRIEE